MLTARLLWRASSNLLTLHPGCCTRPPNGFQSGGNVQFHNGFPSLLAALLKLNATFSKNTSLSRLIVFFIEPFKCTWRSCSIISSVWEEPTPYIISVSFTLVLHWCSFSWDINALTSMLLYEEKWGASKERRATGTSSAVHLRKPVTPRRCAAAAKISFLMASLFETPSHLERNTQIEIIASAEECIISFPYGGVTPAMTSTDVGREQNQITLAASVTPLLQSNHF